MDRLTLSTREADALPYERGAPATSASFRAAGKYEFRLSDNVRGRAGQG